jgi:GntR family transcriptional regulator
MEITVDIDNPPQFEQLIEQIKAACAGVLKPGDSLPSIRQLANDLELNSKTVAKAYQLPTRDSIIETKGYRGNYVHPRPKRTASSTCRSGRFEAQRIDRRVARSRCDRFGNP